MAALPIAPPSMVSAPVSPGEKPTRSSPEQDEARYKKLDTIDAKCGALLAVTSVLLVFVSLPPIFDELRPNYPVTFRTVFVLLLLSCLLALFVLFYKERVSDAFLSLRKFALNSAVCITAACCAVVMFMVLAGL